MTKLKKGMKVKIISTDKTEFVYGINDIMKSMVGNIYTIDYIGTTGAIKIEDCWWKKNDLKPLSDYVDEIPVPEPQLFDVEKLDV